MNLAMPLSQAIHCFLTATAAAPYPPQLKPSVHSIFFTGSSMAIITLLLCSQAYAQTSAIRTSGDLLQIALPVGAAVYSSSIHDTSGLHQLGISTATILASTYLLKHTVQRTRPSGLSHDSFPSGHTAAAFAGTWYLQRRYPHQQHIPWLALAAWVGYSRIQARAHHPTDVLAGAVLAWTSSRYLVTCHRLHCTTSSNTSPQ